MNLGELVPKPNSALKMISAPFEKREGQPWLQGTARNMGHAAFGDKIGNYVDQKWLGDPAPGAGGPTITSPQSTLQQQSSPIGQMIQTWLATGRKPQASSAMPMAQPTK